MSGIKLVHGSCADQKVDVIVNAANRNLWAGGGICGVIFQKAGMAELTAECDKHKVPLKDGDAMSRGIGVIARLVLEDKEIVIYEYGNIKWKLC